MVAVLSPEYALVQLMKFDVQHVYHALLKIRLILTENVWMLFCHAASINYYNIIITLELSAYINTAEGDRFVEVCAVLDDGMIAVGQSII